MIKFEEIIIPGNKLFSNGRSLDVSNIITFKDVEFPDITFNNNEIKVSTNTIEYGKNIDGRGISDSHDLYFKNCSFFGKLEFNGLLNRFVRFDDCSFTDIILKDIQHDNEKATNGFRFIGIQSISSITVDFCEFNGKFYINKQDDNHSSEIILNKLIIKKTVFEENFKLHNCQVNTVEIEDTDFKKNADFFKSKFIQGTLKKNQEENIEDGYIGFKAINFEGLALFGDTKFYKKLIFKYVTFKGHNHFKSATLKEGLDLEYTNIQQEMNFYGIEILDKTSTSQETYRIIKNQFEKLNNKIEANKYHALELEQHRKDIKTKILTDFKSFFKFAPDGLVSLFHWASSNHSSNWFLALFWIFIVSFCTNGFLGNTTIDFSFDGWNNLFKYINILSKIEDFNDSYIAMTLNKVSLGYLYYQFLTAVRKDTRK
jgi:uncharacterized protein YjbI with pentapeptide repeats